VTTLALVPEEPLVAFSDAELVEAACTARAGAEAAEAEAGSPARWRTADCYYALKERGWSTRRIAEACDTNPATVSIATRAVFRYLNSGERPLFWHAYAEITGERPAHLSSESNEWYTPAEDVERARRVLGHIDLDPASCEEANEVVRAARFFDRRADGLEQEWHGRVFLNPPYGGVCPRFVEKLRDEYAAGRVTAAVLLVNAYSTETRWFQALLRERLVCFPDKRIRFWGNAKAEKAAPTYGPAFVYFGSDEAAFLREFGGVGVTVRAVA